MPVQTRDRGALRTSRGPATAAGLPSAVLAHAATFLGPEDLLRLGAVSRDLRLDAQRPALWHGAIAALPPPQPSAAGPEPRRTWLRAQAVHHLRAREGRSVTRPNHQLLAVAAGDGEAVASWQDGQLNVYSAADGAMRLQLRGHPAPVTLLAADRELVAGSGATFATRVWCARTGDLQHVLEEGDGGTAAMALRGRTLVTGGIDRTIRVWDAAAGQLQHLLLGLDGPAMSLVLGESWVAGASPGGGVALWSLADGRLRRALQAPGPISHLAASDEVIAVATRGHEHALWQELPYEVTLYWAGTGEPIRARAIDLFSKDHVTSLAVSGETVVVGTGRGWTDVWTPWSPRPQSFAPLAPDLSAANSAVATILIRGDTLVVGYEDGAAMLASIARGEVRQLLVGETHWPQTETPRTGTLALRGDLLLVRTPHAFIPWHFDQPAPQRPSASVAGALLGEVKAWLARTAFQLMSDI